LRHTRHFFHQLYLDLLSGNSRSGVGSLQAAFVAERHFRYTGLMARAKRLPASFFRPRPSPSVRDWLRSLQKDERSLIGNHIATVECGWPVGMPVCRPMGNGPHSLKAWTASSISCHADRLFIFVSL
jgi:hypothetical protein